MFPILFALIVGHLLYGVAQWKLEQGVTLGTLEQLLGSRTVGATLITQVKLRSFSLLSLGLILIWVFSPLGAQAILRLLGSRFGSITETLSIVHFDSDAPSSFGSMVAASPASYEAIQNSIGYMANWYTALLLAPQTVKTDSMDLWGNLKIPFLPGEEMETAGGNGWRRVPPISTPDSYSSLAGYPITRVSQGNSTFFMLSSYLQLNCTKEQQETWIAEHNLTQINIPTSTYSWADFKYENGSLYGTSRDRNVSYQGTTWSIAVDRFVDKHWLNSSALMSQFNSSEFEVKYYARPKIFENQTGVDSEATHLVFDAVISYEGNTGRGPYYGVTASCDVKQQYIESQVACIKSGTSARQNCTVIAQRPSTQQQTPENISWLSFPQIMNIVSYYLPVATGSMSGRADLSLQYITSPQSGAIINSVGIEYFTNTSDTAFSRRLSQLLNTYILISQTESAISGGSIDPDASFQYNGTVPAEVGNLVRLYIVSKLWVVICFVSCLVLLICGIFSVVFTHLASGPEILGYASTILRDSKFFDLPPETGGMMALNITKAMRHERLRYGFTYLTRRGQRLLGVGREEDTGRIRNTK